MCRKPQWLYVWMSSCQIYASTKHATHLFLKYLGSRVVCGLNSGHRRLRGGRRLWTWCGTATKLEPGTGVLRTAGAHFRHSTKRSVSCTMRMREMMTMNLTFIYSLCSAPEFDLIKVIFVISFFFSFLCMNVTTINSNQLNCRVFFFFDIFHKVSQQQHNF